LKTGKFRGQSTSSKRLQDSESRPALGVEVPGQAELIIFRKVNNIRSKGKM
jgi:hypothetical protein